MSTSLQRRRLPRALPSARPCSLALGQRPDRPIKLGTLTPLTGAGGPDGPAMVSTVKAVICMNVNAAGGVLGSPAHSGVGG